MSFKVGDRIAAYRLVTVNFEHVPERITGTIAAIEGEFISFYLDGYPSLCGQAHVKQCRKLVKKKKEVNPNSIENSKKCMDIIRKFNEQSLQRTPLDYQNELKNSVPARKVKTTYVYNGKGAGKTKAQIEELVRKCIEAEADALQVSFQDCDEIDELRKKINVIYSDLRFIYRESLKMQETCAELNVINLIDELLNDIKPQKYL